MLKAKYFLVIFLMLFLGAVVATLWWNLPPSSGEPLAEGNRPSAFASATSKSPNSKHLPTNSELQNALAQDIPQNIPTFALPTAEKKIPYCDERKPRPADLTTVITVRYGLSAQYSPSDLVLLNDYLSQDVAYGEDLLVRLVALKPLVSMVQAMQTADLHPLIYSAFRDYATQAKVHQHWQAENGNRAESLSAQPGHSEHQLGLAIDFGSPSLSTLVGNPNVQFHPLFERTPEGKWLLAHAQEYGFTLSYPENALSVTGYEYEPWHYRYVGIELATYLHDTHQFFTQYALHARNKLPCIP